MLNALGKNSYLMQCYQRQLLDDQFFTYNLNHSSYACLFKSELKFISVIYQSFAFAKSLLHSERLSLNIRNFREKRWMVPFAKKFAIYRYVIWQYIYIHHKAIIRTIIVRITRTTYTNT